MLAIGVMIWLGSELMFFSGLFAAFFTIRANAFHGIWPPPGTHLDTIRGLIFTLVLVSSSFTMRYAVQQVEWRKRKTARRWIVFTIILGAAFLGNQVTEWLFLTTRWYTNSYGSLFFIMTGLHGIHVFIGLVAMAFLLGRMKGDVGGDPGELRGGPGCELLLALRRHCLDRPLQLPLLPQMIRPAQHHDKRHALRTALVLPASVLTVALLGGLSLFFPLTAAQGSTDPTTTTTTAPTSAAIAATTAAQANTVAQASAAAKAKATVSTGAKAKALKVSSKACGTTNLRGVSPIPNTGNPYTVPSGSAGAGTS